MATDLRRPPAALDPGSFDRFYERHQPEIYRFVLRDVGNRADAEEVTQTAFLDAFRALRRGHEPDKPRAWMYGIARNAARRRYRTQSRRPLEVALDGELVDELSGGEQAQWASAVRTAFAKLLPSHREVIFLREVEDLPYAEIAERMQISQAAVETLLFRARRSLRELLEAEGVRPAVVSTQPKAKRMLGLAFLPALLERFSNRFQHLFAPELATKAAGAVTAVALTAGLAVGTKSVWVDPPAGAADARRATAANAGAGFVGLVTPDWAAGAAKGVPGQRDGKRGRVEDGKRSSDKPRKGDSRGGKNSDASPGTNGLGLGTNGGSLSVDTPSVSAPGVELPALAVPSAPVDLPPISTPPVEVPPVEVPPVEVPPVDAPSLDLPPVEVPPVETPPVELPPLTS